GLDVLDGVGCHGDLSRGKNPGLIGFRLSQPSDLGFQLVDRPPLLSAIAEAGVREGILLQIAAASFEILLDAEQLVVEKAVADRNLIHGRRLKQLPLTRLPAAHAEST